MSGISLEKPRGRLASLASHIRPLRWMHAANGRQGLSSLAEKQLAAQKIASRYLGFVVERVNPGSQERDAANQPIPIPVLREAATNGLLGLSLPRAVGGGGLSPLEWGLVMEELAYVCEDVSFPLVVSLYAAVANSIYESGKPELIRRYVRGVVEGREFCSFAYSEERDPFNFASTLRQAEGGFVLNGRKVIVTGGMMATAFMCYLRDEGDDVKVVLVERSDEGVDVRPVPTMGVRAAGLATLTLTDVKVGRERLVAEFDGLGHVQRLLNKRRLLLTTGIVGRMRAVLDRCLEHVTTTERYGTRLSDMQNVQSLLGRMYVAVETSNVVLHSALAHMEESSFDPIWDATLTAAKYYLTEQALFVGKSAMHVLGGRGYESEYGLERFVRDSMGLIAGSGAQDILQVDLGVWLASDYQRRKFERTGHP